jgi:hypothetical protein
VSYFENLCVSVLSVSAVNHHGDTENTKVAQRNT